MINSSEPPAVVIRNATLLDPASGELTPNTEILVRGGAVAGPEESDADARIVDARGRVVLPGLVDAHVHATAYTANAAQIAHSSPYYVAGRAQAILSGMLARGFTTVRDTAGADYGLAQAVAEGYITGPRLLFGGKALTQTGGHGDVRGRGDDAHDSDYCRPHVGRIADGVDEVRRAARDEIRRGADHIKIMLGGGVASPTDRIDSVQYSEEEIRAAVEEARSANRYVLGHAYTAEAINRGLSAGVRCIEHGNLMDASSVALFKSTRAFYVPTLATYSALAEEGRAAGLPEDSYRKVFEVLDAGLAALERAHRGGVDIAFGTDLLGDMHYRQCTEFRLRAQVQRPIDIIRAATANAARLVGMEGRIGTLAPGAHADLLIVDGNPLEDISVLAEPERHLRLVMRAGAIFRNDLD